MTHWAEIPRGLGACDEALDAAAEYATFEAFWRDCENPDWLLWAVTHGLVAMPFDPDLAAAKDVCASTVKAAWGVYVAAASDARDARDADTKPAWGVYAVAVKTALEVYTATVMAAGRRFAERIRVAAEPFTLGPAWPQEAHEAEREQRQTLMRGGRA